MARQELFQWDQDASKTHLMSTSQDFNRHSITEHSSIMPCDWASVVEPFVQRRSLESNTDSAPQSPFNSDFIGNLQKPNLFAESAQKIGRLKQSDGCSQKITRGVIKLSFIVNQRYTYALYKLRTLRQQPVSMPRMPTSLQTISDTLNRSATNTITFTNFLPPSLSSIKTELYSKKSLKPMSVIQFVQRLKRAIVRLPFSMIRTVEKAPRQKISFEMVNSSLKKDSNLSRGWKKPSSVLEYEPFLSNSPQVNVKETHIPTGRTSKLDIAPSRVANIRPDIKDPIMEDEIESSISIPAPLPASEIQQPKQPSQVTENNTYSRTDNQSQPYMVRQRPTTDYQQGAINPMVLTNIPSLASIPQSQHQAPTQLLYTARPMTARQHGRGLSLEEVIARIGHSPQVRRNPGFRPLSPKSPVSPLSSVNPALFIAEPFRTGGDWTSPPKQMNVIQQKPSFHNTPIAPTRQIPRNLLPNHYYVSPIQFNRQTQHQFVNQYGLMRPSPQLIRSPFRQF